MGDLKIVNLTPSELVPEIINGKKIDAVVLWEPYMNKIESILGENE